MALAPPLVPIGPQDSFHTASLLPPLVHCQYAGLGTPVEVNASLLAGFRVQPSCSWVPPTETTYGELGGHPTVGVVVVGGPLLLLPRVIGTVVSGRGEEVVVLGQPLLEDGRSAAV